MAKEADAVDTSPDTQDVDTDESTSIEDIAALGETEFSEKTKEPETSSPDETKDADSKAASPDDKGDEKVSEDKQVQDGKKPSPGDDDQTKSQADEIDDFLNDMFELKEKSEKEGTDEYHQKLNTLKEEDPIRYRLWRSESRVSGLQQGYQKERQERRRYEKEASELKSKQRKSKLDEFQELTEEELAELSEDERVEYRVQKTEIERRRETEKETEGSEAQIAQFREFEDFVFNQFGIEFDYETDGRMSQDSIKQLNETVPVNVRTKIDNELERLFGKDVVYSAEQIELVYSHVMRDDILHKERIKAREDVKQSQEAALRGQSRLDSLPSNPQRKTQNKKLEDLSVEDIAAMGEKEFSVFEESAT